MTGMFMLDDGIEGWLREYLARGTATPRDCRFQVFSDLRKPEEGRTVWQGCIS